MQANLTPEASRVDSSMVQPLAWFSPALEDINLCHVNYVEQAISISNNGRPSTRNNRQIKHTAGKTKMAQNTPMGAAKGVG
jgi:hypothetical protein